MSQYTDLINHYITNLEVYSDEVGIALEKDAADSFILDEISVEDTLRDVNVPLRECDYVLIMNSGKFLFLTNISVKLPGVTFRTDSNNLWFATPEVTEGSLTITALSPSYNRSILNTWYNSLFHRSGCLNEQVNKVHLCLCSVRKFPQSYDETISSIVNYKGTKSTLGLEEWYNDEVNNLDIAIADKFREFVEKYNAKALSYNALRKNPLTKKKDYLGVLRIQGVFLDCKCGVPEIKIDYQSTNLQRESATISFNGYIHDSFNIDNLDI